MRDGEGGVEETGDGMEGEQGRAVGEGKAKSSLSTCMS